MARRTQDRAQFKRAIAETHERTHRNTRATDTPIPSKRRTNTNHWKLQMATANITRSQTAQSTKRCKRQHLHEHAGEHKKMWRRTRKKRSNAASRPSAKKPKTTIKKDIGAAAAARQAFLRDGPVETDWPNQGYGVLNGAVGRTGCASESWKARFTSTLSKPNSDPPAQRCCASESERKRAGKSRPHKAL